MTDNDATRMGTHWEGCWRDGGRRHYACAVDEAERQTKRADKLEAELAAVAVRAEAAERERDPHERGGKEPHDPHSAHRTR